MRAAPAMHVTSYASPNGVRNNADRAGVSRADAWPD
jgi:hypothetical protein